MHGAEIPSNRSKDLAIYAVIEARTSRRGVMIGGLATIAMGLFGMRLSTKGALAQITGLLGFTAVPLSKDGIVVVPEGYIVRVLAPWATPLTADAPDYVPGGHATAEQFATKDFGLGFPDHIFTVPRSDKLVITRDTGGVIGF